MWLNDFCAILSNIQLLLPVLRNNLCEWKHSKIEHSKNIWVLFLFKTKIKIICIYLFDRDSAQLLGCVRVSHELLHICSSQAGDRDKHLCKENEHCMIKTQLKYIFTIQQHQQQHSFISSHFVWPPKVFTYCHACSPAVCVRVCLLKTLELCSCIHTGWAMMYASCCSAKLRFVRLARPSQTSIALLIVPVLFYNEVLSLSLSLVPSWNRRH